MEQVLTAVRTILIAVGAFLIGHTIFNHTVSLESWEVWVGGVLSLAGGIWSWIDKKLLAEQKMSLVRNALTFIGGIVVAGGYVTETLWMNIAGGVTALLSLILSNLIKSKNEALATGKISTSQLVK